MFRQFVSAALFAASFTMVAVGLTANEALAGPAVNCLFTEDDNGDIYCPVNEATCPMHQECKEWIELDPEDPHHATLHCHCVDEPVPTDPIVP